MAEEERGALYKIRWEILVMAVTLGLIALVVLAIPSDFSERMLAEQKQQKELREQKELEESMEEGAPTEMTGGKP